MQFQLFSDLHLETQPDFAPIAVKGVDLLVLAGDIGSYQIGSQLKSDDFGLSRFSPRQAQARWSRVLFLPGNHEFDGLDFDEIYSRLRSVCDHLGIEWLDHEVIVIDDTRFVGSTLWSDFDALASSLVSEELQLKAREKAFRAANFYLQRNTTLRNGQPMLAQDIRQLSLESQDWLRRTLTSPYNGKTVAVTHFAPTLRSADPRYGLTPGTAGFCNSNDDLLQWADVWVHGHLHCFNDYVVRGQRGSAEWECRVVANPLGYVGKGEQETFRPSLVVQV